jgi:hypothetical protein
MLPLYSQGYSLCRYLIGQGGKRKFMEYLAKGMSREQWDAVTQEFYGYQDLSELQVTWVEWVRAGSPEEIPSRSASASEENYTLANTKAQAPLGEITRPPSASDIAASSYYEQKMAKSPKANLAKPMAGRPQELTGGPAKPSSTVSRPMAPQSPQQRPLAWGEGAALPKTTSPKPIPSASRTGAYESPNYREAAKSVSVRSRSSGTSLR